MRNFIFVFSFLIATASYADGFSDIITYNLGMANYSVTENESSLVQTDTTVATTSTTKVAAATSVAATSFELSWEFGVFGKKSYFIKALVPLMTVEGAGVFAGGVGINWYFNELGSKFEYYHRGGTITIIPKFKYYAGGSASIGYLVYNTTSAKKSDVFFALGMHGGATYAWGETWGTRLEVGAERVTGVATTGIGIKIFLGATYYL